LANALAIGILGCLIGDTAWYGIGKRWGTAVLRTLCEISFEPETCVPQGSSFISCHGSRALIITKFVPGGLRQPEYCGGVAEVAKDLWMRHVGIRPATLVDYALRLSVGAVTRHLGYLMELYRIAPEEELVRLREPLTATYHPLDPLLPREGPHLARWRL